VTRANNFQEENSTEWMTKMNKKIQLKENSIKKSKELSLLIHNFLQSTVCFSVRPAKTFFSLLNIMETSLNSNVKVVIARPSTLRKGWEGSAFFIVRPYKQVIILISRFQKSCCQLKFYFRSNNAKTFYQMPIMRL
jgi:Cft2 family RNA processing exonuclease